MGEKIRIIWVCHLSNKDIHRNLKYSFFYYRRILSQILHKPILRWNEFAVWNTNAIKQFEKFDDIDLTIVFPYAGIKGNIQYFDINNIHYVAFRSEDDYLLSFLKSVFCKKIEKKYQKNRIVVSSIIRATHPDIVHIIGAENPYYSIIALDLPTDIPSVVTLQTLLSEPDFIDNYPISKSSYEYRADLEKKIIRKCTYIGSSVERYQSVIKKQIKKDAIFLNMPLAVGVEINDRPIDSEYDFVYFAANIDKAGDYAIEAFALASIQHPGLTLNISGSYLPEYKHKLDNRLRELGLQNNVFFTGAKETHDDVLLQIKKSRFALLPLKVDLISGTIREAMACGIPVITTITPATPKLNKDYECILLSEKGDFQSMADNMLRLVKNKQLAESLRANSLKYMRKEYSNEKNMQLWRKAYYEIVDNHNNGIPFSKDIKNNN